MAIRFRCSACSQPIEIDDEWASKAVACPYCRKTVTAPAETMFEDLSQVPMASPAAGAPLLSAETPPDAAPTLPPQKNTIALVAIILAITSIGMMMWASSLMAGHTSELEALQKISEESPTIKEQTESLSKFFEDYPDTEKWLFPAGFLGIAGFGASLASIICALLGLRRSTRRGMAIAALLTAGLVPVMMCCGGAIFG